jgi:Tfp pilus assembly protein PilV
MKEKSFTLIETVISIFIFSVGVIGLMLALYLGVQMTSKSKMQTCASKLAQDKMEEIISLPYEEITSSFEDYGTIESFDSYKRVSSVYYYDPDSFSTTTVDTGLKFVDMSVFWDSSVSGVEKSIKFKTLIHE